MKRLGFSLIEMAVVLAIFGLVLGSTLFSVSAQFENRNRVDTERRLEHARELLLSYALVHGRLPCPAVASGDEAGGGSVACTSNYGGFLPARTIGFQPADSAGFGLDAWGNRIRYAVSGTQWGPAPTRFYTPTQRRGTVEHRAKTGRSGRVHLRTGGCDRARCDAGASLTNQNTVVALVFSTGRNALASGANEARNLDENALFVSRPPDPPTACRRRVR